MLICLLNTINVEIFDLRSCLWCGIHLPIKVHTKFLCEGHLVKVKVRRVSFECVDVRRSDKLVQLRDFKVKMKPVASWAQGQGHNRKKESNAGGTHLIKRKSCFSNKFVILTKRTVRTAVERRK